MTDQPLSRAIGGARCRWLAAVVEMAAVASRQWPRAAAAGLSGWPCHAKVATRTPRGDSTSVRAARQFVLATLRRWEVGPRSDDIAVVASELLTNALRHALPAAGAGASRWGIRLALLQLGSCVLCAVADPCPAAPAARVVGHLAETGRGLQVVGALSDAWGHTPPTVQGKVVWAMFATGCRAPAPARR